MIDKELISAINDSLILTYFICNILFLITPETNFKEVIIVETCFIPLFYFLVFIIGYLVEKDII